MIDGKSMLYALREELNEGSTSAYMDDRTSYRFFHEAAMAFVDRTACITASQSITTSASQQSYTLDADYMRLYLKNPQNQLYIKYNDGTTDHFIPFREYEDLIYENQTTAVSVPNSFTIVDDTTKDSQLTGTCTTDVDDTSPSGQGIATLTDSAASFADVSPGDIVHNTTDSSDGVVLSKTSSTVLVCALFGGTDNDFDSSDAYVIQPQARRKIYFSEPTSTASHTVTVSYIKKPDPVYSAYGIYRIDSQHLETLVEYAAFKYKRRDMEPGFASDFLGYWDQKVRKATSNTNQALVRKGFTVNMRKRTMHGR